MISKNIICSLFLTYLFGLFIFVNEPKILSIIGIIIYFFIDIIFPPKLKLDMFIHHVSGIFLGFCALFEKNLHWNIVKILFETEYSTIFLVLEKYGFKNSLIYILFFTTFTYFRIFKLGIIFIYLYFYNFNNNFPNIMVYAFYSLYFLNLYWYVKIIKYLFFSQITIKTQD